MEAESGRDSCKYSVGVYRVLRGLGSVRANKKAEKLPRIKETSPIFARVHEAAVIIRWQAGYSACPAFFAEIARTKGASDLQRTQMDTRHSVEQVFNQI